MNPLFIVEIGHNWNGDIELAKKMIWVAKDFGADIIKVQLYDIDKIKIPSDTHYQELKDSQLTRKQMIELSEEVKKAGIEFMASAFDTERVQWLEEIGVKRHKLASRSIYDQDLIQTMVKTGKPIIVSLGTWKKKELPIIENAEFLYCLTRREIERFGVRNFPEKFDKLAGFSDHTIGIEYIMKAIDRGARIIEKHFTLDKNLPGCDQAGSATTDEFKEIVDYAKSK